METKANTVKLTIDGKEVQVDEGATILEAARQNGIKIPTLCQHDALSNWGGCRMCVVEVDGSPKLVASCVMPVRSGMQVVTTNDAIIESRRTMLEFLFAERNHNCMFCPQSGDCELQQLAYELQMDHLTVSFSYNKFPTDVTSDYMAIDHSRCILCGRCVRACKEIAGQAVLNFQNRGPKSLIGMDLAESREQSTCGNCGVCVQVCPTGAMVNRYRGHYSVKGHSKQWRQIESVCPQCGLLCETVAFVKDNNLIKIEGRLGPDTGRPDRGQLCYRGRFEALKNKGRQIESPLMRDAAGAWKAVGWGEALAAVSARFAETLRCEGGAAIFGLASSALSNEELSFFKELMTNGWSAGYLDTFDGKHFRTFAAARRQAGESFSEASWKKIPEADLLILIGAAPYQSQPVVSGLVRKGLLQGGQKVAVLGRSHPVQPYTPWYFPVADIDLPRLIRALKLGGTGVGYGNDILEKAGLNPEAAKAFQEVAKALTQATNPLFIVGEKLTGLEYPATLADVISQAQQKGVYPDKSLRLIVLKPCGNSAGAWKLGVAADGRAAAADRWKAGLVLLSELDEGCLPALQALERVDFMAAISPYFPESLFDKIDVLIPKPRWLEEAGTFTSLDGRETAYRPNVLQPREGMLNSWQILQRLSKRAASTSDDRSRAASPKKIAEEIGTK